ncbi:MAG: Hsp33 family molecular chaperone HslO [Stomatobaculum sp.]|nr:Hsp33 family molecular chaperone HslO [Stomatobaculum sp.]
MKDYMVRAYAAGGYVRAFAVTTAELTEEARKIHSTSPVATAALGRLMAAGLMMGAMMKDEQDLLTLKIDGTGPMRGILVTADCKGNVKGYPYESAVILPPNEKGKLDVSGALGEGILTTISDIGMKEPYVGQVKLVSGEIAEDIAYYYASSEQVPSSVGLGVLVDPDHTVNCAGGFIIQLMPGCPEETVSALEDRLKGIDSVTTFYRSSKTPEDLLTLILGDMELQFTDKMPCQYHCGCTRQRVEKALISVGEKELRSMIDEGKPVEMNCHFCGKNYTFSVEEMEKLLESAK